MTAVLSATPTPLAPSAVLTVVGSGFANEKTRLRMNNTIVSGTFHPTGGAFSVKVTVPATTGIHNLVAQQRPGHTWLQVANPVPVVVQAATPAPKIVGNPVVDPIDQTTATIAATFDQPVTCQIEYGPVASPQTYPYLTTLEPNYYLTHSQDLTGLTAGTLYKYRIRSGNANGSAALVERSFGTLAATPTLAAPGAPTGLTATPGDTTVDLAWVTPASDGGSAITAYKPYRDGVLITTVGAVNVFHDVGRTNGVSYVYTVKAVNAVGDSTASGSASATPAGSALVFPPDRNPLIFKAETVPSIPAIGTPLLDPDWNNTHLRRLGAANSFRQLYSRHQVENSDKSLILMGWSAQPGGGQAPRLLHGTTYADLGAFPGGLIDMALWSNLDPNKLFGVEQSNALFRSQNATTGVRTTLHDFSGTYASISIGDYEGGISDDDKYVALIGTTSGGAKHLLTYRIDTNAIIADIAAPAGISDCQISRLGTYVTLACGAGIRCYPRDLSGFITLQAGYSHGDNALDASGNEIYVVNNSGLSNSVVAYRLSTGVATALLTGRPAFEAGHTGGHTIPGWVGLSNYDETFYGTNNVKPGRNQVALVKTDGSGTLKVYGHTRHLYDNSNPDKRYTNEPQASFSRDATRAFFVTNWRDVASWGYPMVAYA